MCVCVCVCVSVLSRGNSYRAYFNSKSIPLVHLFLIIEYVRGSGFYGVFILKQSTRSRIANRVLSALQRILRLEV